MSILADKNTRVLVQGVTGTQAAFHVQRSLQGGTKIVCGTSPNHGGETHLGLPVFNTVSEAKKECAFDASVLFVPARALKSAVREAVEAEVPLAVSIADNVPIHDMLEIKAMLKGSKTMLIGPNTPGLITPEEARLGIFPENIHHKGSVGIISRASTLTYEAVLETNAVSKGQSTVVGLGDDMIIGTDFCVLLDKFMEDKKTKAVILVGKADGYYEQMAAEHYAGLKHKKPVIAFIAGAALPSGYTMGYAMDIVTYGRVTVADKKKMMQEAGMTVVDSMQEIRQVLLDLKL